MTSLIKGEIGRLERRFFTDSLTRLPVAQTIIQGIGSPHCVRLASNLFNMVCTTLTCQMGPRAWAQLRADILALREESKILGRLY